MQTEQIPEIVDEVVALHITPALGAIGAFYLSFDQFTDAEVIELMKASNKKGFIYETRNTSNSAQTGSHTRTPADAGAK